jgi:hypothetical protein
MTLDPQIAMRATQLLLGIGVALQAAEVLVTRKAHAKLCAGNRPLAFSEQWLTAKMIMQLFIATPLIIGLGKYLTVIEPVFYIALIISTAGLILRFSGPLGSGSDSMSFQVLIGLLIASFGIVNPILTRVGFGWIAAQTVLSYFLAGVAKLRNENWRNGIATGNLLRAPEPYSVFNPARRLANSQRFCFLAGWVVVGFEIVFPIVLFLPWEGKIAVLSAGLVFHIANAVLLGLNRFIWAWAATYPALLYFN